MIDENKLLEELNKKAKEFDQECGYFLNKCEFQEAYRCAGKTLGIVAAMEIVQEQEKIEVPFSRTENEWIPVSECLPKQDEKSEYYTSVIVTLDNGRVAEGCYRDKEKEWWADAPDGEHYSENVTGHVIAWMPLPEPYKPETHESKKQTNADRIRNMTDEEMADFLMDISMGMLFDKKIMNVKSWLQSEVEE